MRLLISISFILVALTTFGQRSIRKAYILVDGKPTSYKEYRKMDVTKFQEIKVLPGSEERIKIFGRKAKNGIVHLKTASFISNQKELLNGLKKEFEENRLETTMLVINGIPIENSQISNEVINKLNEDTVEIISVPEVGTVIIHRNKKVIVIVTNVTI